MLGWALRKILRRRQQSDDARCIVISAIVDLASDDADMVIMRGDDHGEITVFSAFDGANNIDALFLRLRIRPGFRIRKGTIGERTFKTFDGRLHTEVAQAFDNHRPRLGILFGADLAAF